MIWYPQAPYGVSGLPQTFLSSENQHFPKKSLSDKNFDFLDIFDDYAYFWKPQIDAERNSMQTSCRNSSWTLISSRLVTRTLSNNCEYIAYIYHIWFFTYDISLDSTPQGWSDAQTMSSTPMSYIFHKFVSVPGACTSPEESLFRWFH